MNESWNIRRIGDVCRVIPGFAFKSADWCNKGIPVVKITNISSDNHVDILNADCVPESLITPKTSKYLLKYGDILVAMTGATAGKVGRLLVDRQIFLNQRVAKIEPVEADRDYIWSLVSSQEYQKRFFGLADGAAQPNMSGSQIESVEIPFPPLPIQRRIASILSAYDDLIENNRKRIAILEEMARRLYREWFVHFRYPGHESVPMVDSLLGRIPQGWETVPASALTDVLSGGTPKTENPAYWGGDIPFFTPKDAHSETWVTTTEKRLTVDGLNVCHSALFPRKTLFITARGTVGKLALAHIPMAMNQSCYALQPKSNLSPEYLFLTMSDAIARFKAVAIGGVFDTIVVDTFNRIHLIRPPMDLTTRLTSRVEPMLNLVENLQVQSNVLRRTRDLLLPRLMSGQLSVTAAEAAAP